MSQTRQEYKREWYLQNRTRISLQRIEDYRHKRGSYEARLDEFNIRIASLTQTDIAYIAGIVDGEGTIHFSRLQMQTRFIQVGVSIANTDQDLMEWLQAKLGGLVKWQDGWQRNGRPAKPVARLMVNGRMAASLCRVLLPYLQTTKRKKAELVIRVFEPPFRVFRIDVQEEHRREQLWQEFKAI